MGKPERRRSSNGSDKNENGAARTQNAAKQAAAGRAAARRSSQKPSSTLVPNPLPWLRRNAQFVAVGVIAIVVVLLFESRSSNDDDGGKRDRPRKDGSIVPRIDGTPMELDEERESKTGDFLNDFVCSYRPGGEIEAADATKAVDIEGYCHPRLSADPQHRTQRVSGGATAQAIKKWWQKDSSSDQGIPAGELVMKLPRPLQIWDLDALRDNFIRRIFLGLDEDDNGNDAADAKPKPKMVARHKETQNQLDSGAFLAVYLIRLLNGSHHAWMMDESNDGQCDDENGECKSLQQWDDLGQHKQRINQLSAYLDMLPTIEDRTRKSTSSQINPHNHPLFWSKTMLQSFFPQYTYTHDLIRHHHIMMMSEYDAFALMSDEFRTNVKYMDYLTMRVNVLSRAFGLPAATGDGGVLWGVSDDAKGLPLAEELKLYDTSNFGSFLDDDAKEADAEAAEDEFKLRSMCPLLDMYNSHPNPNVSWRYDSKTSSYLIHANQKSGIPPGDSIVVSYGKYTDGHLFAKYGYVNGDGTAPTEINLAVFHRLLGDVGLGRQYSPLPFHVWDAGSRDEILGKLLDGGGNVDPKMQRSLASAKKALGVQTKELIRYLAYDDGYEECIEVSAKSNSSDEELKLLKLRHLIRIANLRKAWVVRIPPKFPDALPLQIHGKETNQKRKETKDAVAVSANRIISVCRLLSLRADDIDGEAVDYLREGLSTTEPFFVVEKHGDALEYRSMMCVARLCNIALGRYLDDDRSEPKLVGSREWNAWYIITEEIRALTILLRTATTEADSLKQQYLLSKGSTAETDAAITVRENGACNVNFTLPLLKQLRSDR